VDAAAVGRDACAVTYLDSADHPDDFIGHRIDDVDVVARTVGLDNADLALGGESTCAEYDAGQNREVRTNRMLVGHRVDSFAVCPRTQAFSVCHSGSFCELQCLPPL